MRYVHEWRSGHGSLVTPVEFGWYVMKGKGIVSAYAEAGPFKTVKEAEARLAELEAADAPKPKPVPPPKPVKAPKALPTVKEFDKKVLAREAKKGAKPKAKKPAPKKKKGKR